MTVSERVYRLMLRLYPAAFRQEYGEVMIQTFRDMRRDAAGRGLSGMVSLWLYLIAETASRAVIEHRDALRRRDSMSSTYSPSKIDLLLVFIPMIAIMVYIYLFNDSRDTPLIYLLILLTGLIVHLANRIGLFGTNRLWNTYTFGILLGAGTLIGNFIVSLPAFGVYRLGLPPFAIFLTTLLIYAAGVRYTARWTGAQARLYIIAAVLLALIEPVTMLIDWRRSAEPISRTLTINYGMVQSLSVLFLTALCIWLLPRIGRRALILLMLALGVQFIIVDPSYFTGSAGRWINLTVLLFPLILCPAWLVVARTRRSQLWGAFVLWAILILVVSVAPSIARVTMGLDYETPAIWISRVLKALPYLAAMGLVLRAASSSDADPEWSVPMTLRDNPA